jgi:outer membrane protein assembly factor BamB
MASAQTDVKTSQKPIRLWPGVAAAVLLVLLRFVVPVVVPDGGAIVGVIGGVVCAVAVLVWWVFFSRAPWSERLGAIVVIAIAVMATRSIVHPSIRGGMMGMMLPFYAVPVSLAPAFVAWAVASRRLSVGLRRASMVAAILLGCGVWLLLRTDGIKGSGAQLHWRWTPTAEQRLLAQAHDETLDAAPSTPVPTATPPATPEPLEPTAAAKADATAGKAAAAPAEPAPVKTESPASAAVVKHEEWPGFRGPDRDGAVRGVRIATDWAATPPVQLWRRPIGPGWSSFAVAGDFFYTQEQRGEDEIVSCYRMATGQPVWRHRDAVRFWESNGGAGPRATPTLHNGRVYAFGATGILNALDGGTGAVVWSRNVASDTHRTVPMWGFASSPLVVGDIVIAAASGTLAGYDLATGNLRWVGPSHGGSYSSPILSTLDGVQQVVLLSGAGATSVAPAKGTVLWEHAWEGTTIVQPAVIGDRDILVTTSGAAGGVGIRRLAVTHGPDGWKAEERWTSTGLKPYFNDYVVHKGHAYGFDGAILSCIDLQDGKRVWKGGRYGNGQLVLLADQDLLLVMSEEGELALVNATPDQFTELTRFPALQDKTWNHPVVVGDVLLVRNGEEMAAFRLPLAAR